MLDINSKRQDALQVWSSQPHPHENPHNDGEAWKLPLLRCEVLTVYVANCFANVSPGHKDLIPYLVHKVKLLFVPCLVILLFLSSL